MPRVVPSQIVAFIDTIPLPPAEGFSINPPLTNSAELSGLADLLGQIPEELLTMDGDVYVAFVCYRARLREMVSDWANQPHHGLDTGRVLFSAQADAIRGIRYALAQCPDEAPAPGTSELNFITDPDLRANLRNDIGAINRA